MKTHPKKDFKKELKFRLLYAFIAFFLAFITAYEQRDLLFYLILEPLMQNSASGVDFAFKGFLFFKITEALQAHLYLSFLVGLLMSLPIFWLQVWFFFAPALYKNEQKLFLRLVFSSLTFLFSGIFFAKNILVPRIWSFLLSFGSLTGANFNGRSEEQGFELVTDLQYLPSLVPYLEFFFEILFAILLSSQIPLLLFLALHWNWINNNFLVQKRPFVIIIFLGWAALLSPPDLMSQIVIFIPLFISYECLILFLFWQKHLRLSYIKIKISYVS